MLKAVTVPFLTAPVPRLAPLSAVPLIRRFPTRCVSVKILPILVAVPLPVYLFPPQQTMYWPSAEFHIIAAKGDSFSIHTSKNVIVNEHIFALPDVSVAVQVTVVVPRGKNDPEGGTHATPTPGQLSLAIGAG